MPLDTLGTDWEKRILTGSPPPPTIPQRYDGGGGGIPITHFLHFMIWLSASVEACAATAGRGNSILPAIPVFAGTFTYGYRYFRRGKIRASEAAAKREAKTDTQFAFKVAGFVALGLASSYSPQTETKPRYENSVIAEVPKNCIIITPRSYTFFPCR